MKKPILTPDHERWEEFCERLANDALGFKRTERGFVHNCKCDKPSGTLGLIKEMGFAQRKSIKLLFLVGGTCDCRVLQHVPQEYDKIQKTRNLLAEI